MRVVDLSQESSDGERTDSGSSDGVLSDSDVELVESDVEVVELPAPPQQTLGSSRSRSLQHSHAAPAGICGRLTEQNTAFMLKELGQEGLPFVVVKREATRAGGGEVLRALRVQQNPPISSFAPFVAHGQIVPVISVDPDVTKRPEVIVIRITPEQVQHRVPLEANYHHLLQQQRSYQFPTDQGVVTLPPWLMLDTEALPHHSRRPPNSDLASALAAQISPYPPIVESDLLFTAMDSLHSFYLRRPTPDAPSGTPLCVPNAKALPPQPAYLETSLQSIVGAPAPERCVFAPISLPRMVVQRIQAMPSSSGRHNVHAPDGAHIVQTVHMRVGDDGATATTCVEIKAAPALPAPLSAVCAPMVHTEQQPLPLITRKRSAAYLEVHSAGSVPSESLRGPGCAGPNNTAAGPVVSRGPLPNGDPLGGVNPVAVLYQHSQVTCQQVVFDNGRQIDTEEGERKAWEMSVRVGKEAVGTGQGKTKKDAKRATALCAVEYLGLVPPGAATAMHKPCEHASTYISASARHGEAGTSTKGRVNDGIHSMPRERSAYGGSDRTEAERSSRREAKRARLTSNSEPASGTAKATNAAHVPGSTSLRTQPRY